MLPKGREMVDAAHVQEKYDIAHPSTMRDLQALMGDSAVRVLCVHCIRIYIIYICI